MKPQHLIGVGVLVAGLQLGTVAPVLAQHPTDNIEFMFSNLRPTGQPVIPIFDGWYQKPDGTYDLCFGYFNLNTKESLEIPLGRVGEIGWRLSGPLWRLALDRSLRRLRTLAEAPGAGR